ncbi:MAG: TraC family protein [Desulfobacterales bacterium]|nr:TraC family protein [Desulfobacterales bacterium]
MNIRDLFINFLCLDELKNSDLKKLTRRDKFSKYLPYISYDPETEFYNNVDGSTGMVFECVPLILAGDMTYKTLETVIKMGWPKNTVMQAILYADPDISGITDKFRNSKKGNKLSEEVYKNLCDYYKEGTGSKGLSNIQNTPIRNFRLLITIKVPKQKHEIALDDLKENVMENLKGAGIYPHNLSPENLINFVSSVINTNPPKLRYNDNKRINEQIILADTKIEDKGSFISLSEKKKMGCLSITDMPEDLNNLTFNLLTGGIDGHTSDGDQIKCPFLMVTNVVFSDLKKQFEIKSSILNGQKGGGDRFEDLTKQRNEYSEACRDLRSGGVYVKIIPLIWFFAEEEKELNRIEAKIKRMYQMQGMTAQREKGISTILFLSSLPFGLFTENKQVELIGRDHPCNSKHAVKALPVQADYCGSGFPYLLFISRKGQLIGYDLFNKDYPNSNVSVCAASGTGKSFNLNYILDNYHASGNKVRIIDIGGSYRKICAIKGGKYIHFEPKSDICLNPFTKINNDQLESLQEKKDSKNDLDLIKEIIAQMIYSSSNEEPSEDEYTIILNATKKVFEVYGNDGDIDKVYNYLLNPHEFLEKDFLEDDLIKVSKNLALNLREFTTLGNYGKWFNGKANVDIANDDFVVLELDELMAMPELFKVVTLQVINYITQDLFLSNMEDRTKKTIIVFEECAYYFSSGNKMMEAVIDGAYRRARKYGGSIFSILQSILDIKKFGKTGDVLWGNSAVKLLLESSEFPKAKEEKLIDYDDFIMEKLKNMKAKKPQYSEIFLDCPHGIGFLRLVVDPYSYFMYSSDPAENARMFAYKKDMDWSEVFYKMVEDTKK